MLPWVSWNTETREDEGGGGRLHGLLFVCSSASSPIRHRAVASSAPLCSFPLQEIIILWFSASQRSCGPAQSDRGEVRGPAGLCAAVSIFCEGGYGRGWETIGKNGPNVLKESCVFNQSTHTHTRRTKADRGKGNSSPLLCVKATVHILLSSFFSRKRKRRRRKRRGRFHGLWFVCSLCCRFPPCVASRRGGTSLPFVSRPDDGVSLRRAFLSPP